MKPGNLSTISFMPEIYGHEHYEYLLVANLSGEVKEKVKAETLVFYEEYKAGIAVTTQPHIMFAKFLAKEAMEDTSIRWMENIFTHQQSFPATLNNYSGFPPHTIYLRLQDMTPFQKVAKDLKPVNTYIRSCGFPPMKLIPNPYVRIAGNLPEDVYFKALTQYARKSFHESFMIDELLLLKRKHQYDACKIIKVFALKSTNNEPFN